MIITFPDAQAAQHALGDDFGGPRLVQLLDATLYLADAEDVLPARLAWVRAGNCPHCAAPAADGAMVCGRAECDRWLYGECTDSDGRALSDARMLAELARPLPKAWRETITGGLMGAAAAIVLTVAGLAVAVWLGRIVLAVAA